MRLDGPSLQRRAAAARRRRPAAPSPLERDLREAVRGEVRFDAGHRAAYAHDASNHRQPPLGVVVPRDVDDVVAAVAVAREHDAPVLPRGGGTGLAGATVNAAVVLDCSKHLTRILDVDPGRRLARVEPGVVRDDLARAAGAHGLTFGPDTSTHAVATLGGMLGHNSCGVHSVTAGRTSDNTHELEVLLYDGTRATVGPGRAPAHLLDRLVALRDRHADAIREGFPDLPRRVSGYNLDDLLPERGTHVARALVGSEGTLVTILGATVHLVEEPPHRALAVLGFRTIADAADHAPAVLEHGPSGLEGMDATLLGDLRGLAAGDGWLLAEFAAPTAAGAEAAARRAAASVQRRAAGVVVLTEPDDMRRVWRTRERALGQASYLDGEAGRLPGWEDAAVPPARLGAYLRAFSALLDRYGYRTALYGHFGDGCVHCRISFDLATAAGLRAYRSFLDEAADLVVAHGGSLSGEHGDGQARSELLPRMFGPQLIAAFAELKAVFDPSGRMNPHRVVDPVPVTRHLKDFAAAERVRCVGAGVCRDTTSGTMCPSYMATRDERHSTRGRARILHELLEGEVIADGHASEDVHAALDLCLSCKACRSECPVGVDMAAYKAEFLAGYHRRRGLPRAAVSMGLIGWHAPVAARAPRLVNALAATRLAKRLAGIAPERPAPPFARRTFRAWWAARAPVNAGGPPAVLFADTFGDCFEPHVLRAAAEALERAGFHVHVPPRSCCGRPLYDFGLLGAAGRALRGLVRTLEPTTGPIVVTEPSCLSTFHDELPRRLAGDPAAGRLAARAGTLAQVLLAAGHAPARAPGSVLLHAHCHQAATTGFDAEPRLLRHMGLDVEVLDAGCCGMAGAFGFQPEHLDVSLSIGERRLFPAVRSARAEDLVVADGFSCRTQVAHATGRRALHLAEVLAR